MNGKRLLEIIGEIDERHILEAAPAVRKSRSKLVWVKWGGMAACMVLILSACLGAFAIAAEAKEYETAVQFFQYYDMSTEGLTRGEIKAVYRDITTKSFSYSKTAEVIQSSISPDTVGGYEIPQEDPTPEDVETLWNQKNFTGQFAGDTQMGVHYLYRAEYKEDPALGFEVFDTSYIEKYDGETLLWSVPVPEFRVEGCSTVSDGVIAYGVTDTWSSTQDSYAWMVKIDTDGQFIWKQMLNHGFENESIAEVVENADGSYAIFSRGDLTTFCLSQYSVDGEQTSISRTEIGNYGIWNAARLGDGYIVQLGNVLLNEHAKIVKVDYEGIITDSFSYSGEDAYYYIADMIEFNGNVYLSAYAVPKLADEEQSAGGRYEIAAVLNYLFDNGLWDISSEELTPMVRENYTAMLLVCDPVSGTPQEFYSVKGSLGSELAVSDTGELLWNVESITSTFFSPATSSFTIGGTSCVYQYTFDNSGQLIRQEKTGEIVEYRR